MECFLYGASDPSQDGNEGIHFPTVALKYGYKWIIFAVFVFKGLFEKYIMAIYEINDLEDDGWGWALVGGSYYALDVWL